MDVYRGVESIPPGRHPAVLTIGNFDGVHLAHRQICRLIREEADRRGGRCAVLTFEPHPLSVVAPERCPPLMTTLEEKLARLEECGVDAAVVQPFTRELAGTTAEEFIRRIVHEGARAEAVVVGYNFRFGKGRAGDVNLLQEARARWGFEVRVIEPQFFGGEQVSSSDVRRRLGEGMVEEAAKLLGRCHLLEGEVVRGEGRGRQIGIPTANLDYPSILVPAKGVYACWAQLDGRDGRRLPAVTNIGDRPTFGGNGVTVEAHLLEGGGGDLYGRKLRVEFVSRLREERKFPSPEALLAQIRADVEEGRRRLEPGSNPG